MPTHGCLGRSVLALIACAFPLFALPANYDGRRIAAIQFEPARQPFHLDQLKTILGLTEGRILKAGDIQAAIQRLYSTGDYADIAVDGTPQSDGGVALRFVTQPNYFIGSVRVSDVPEPPNRGQLAAATKLQLGAEYEAHDEGHAVENLEDILRRNGYYQAVIAPSVTKNPETQQVNFYFAIEAGKRARFGDPVIRGVPDQQKQRIVRASGWKRIFGHFGYTSMTASRVQSGVEAVRKYFQNGNHLLAKVTLAKLDYDPHTNRVTPELDITEGPVVRVMTRGAKISKGKLQQLLPIYQERSLDKDLLVEGRRNLLEYFESEGYFDAEVNFTTESGAAGEETITYEIDRARRHKLVSLRIQGNKYFDSGTLRERMYVTPASFPRYRYGRFSQEYLERDLNSIRDLYRSNGFRDVEVTSTEDDNYKGKKNNLAVVIQVNERQQWFVSSLDLEGVPVDDRIYIQTLLQSTQGQPYSDLNVASDRDRILDYYYNNGYPNATFEFTAKAGSGPRQEALEFVVNPGKREFVRNVLVSGLVSTKPSLVNERISLKAGDPLSESQMSESQRRLYDLGIFAKVQTAVQNPDGDEPDKYVLYQTEEAHKYSLNAGFGAEIARIGGAADLQDPAGATGFSPEVSFGISRLNVLGLGHTVSVQTLLSTIRQRGLFNYLAPQFIGNPNLSLQFTGLFEISRDVRTFSAQREEGSVQLAQKLTKALTLQYRYTFRKVRILGTPLVEPELIPLVSQPERVGIFSTTLILDRRDDPLDPHRGVYTTIDLGEALQGVGSQTDFSRVLFRNATYYKLTKDLVFARSTDFGVIHRTGGLSEVPFAEHFFSGGSTSDRAFPQNQAGPRDPITGFPLGGNALLFNTFELRFPLIGDNLGGVLFNDMGNVYSDLSHISLRFHQQNLQDFNYGVQSLGFGIRYKTPVGPIRLDLSFSPNSPRFFGFKGTEDDLLFNRPNCTDPRTGLPVQCTAVQRINAFQFHFAIGQAF